MPTTMARFGIRVRARVGPQQVPDEHRPRRAYETTKKQNPRPTSVEQHSRGARTASYGEGRGLWRTLCRPRGTYVRKGRPLVVTFPGADVRSARTRGDGFARFFSRGTQAGFATPQKTT